MFELIKCLKKRLKKMFFILLTRIVNAWNYTKCIFLSNQQWKTQSTLIKLHPNEYSQELHYYPFVVNLDICVKSCKTLGDLSNRICFQTK